MEKVETKIDGMAEQLRAEIRMEIMKGVETLRLELLSSKNPPLTAVELASSGSGSGVVDLGSSANNQKSGAVISGVKGLSNLRGKSVTTGTENQTTSSDFMKLNPRRSKLDCPRFNGFDFLGWRLKVEQFFEAVNLPEEEKVPTVMIHLDGKALQWHQRFMRSKGSLKSVVWSEYVLEMQSRFHDSD